MAAHAGLRGEGRPTARGEARVRAATATPGGGALVRLVDAISASGQRLRAIAGDGSEDASGGVHDPDVGPHGQDAC